MLELLHSNRTEKLVEILAGRIDAQRRVGHVLDPVTIVVPNRNLETYLNLSLAQRHGISAGLDFLRLERLAAMAAGDRREVRIVGRAQLRAGLLALFHDDERLTEPALSPVRDYLFGRTPEADALDRAATDLRRVQLSERLSSVMENHQWTRPEQVRRWLTSPDASPDPEAEGLAPELIWQASLWRALHGPEGVLCASAERDGGLPHATLAERILDPRLELWPPAGGFPLHVFGVSYFGRLFHHLFQRLAGAVDISVHLLNPSRHYWDEFVLQGPAIADAEGEDPLHLAEQPCLPLALWGKPGGEHLRLLREVAGGDSAHEDADYLSPGRATILHQVQDDLLEQRGPAEITPFVGSEAEGPPASLQALACPSLRREVEAVADRIWHLIGAEGPGAPLRFHEIAVVVPPAARDRYLPMITQVFEAHHRLPHTTADLSFGARAPLAQAARLLLELPFGRFTRAELLGLLTHPAFDRGAGQGRSASEIDAGRFAELADAAGIFFGRDDRDTAGTYLGPDAAHWSQGLTRLALGQALGGERGGEPELLYQSAGRTLAPEDLGASDPGTTRAFGLLARSLLADLTRLRDDTLPLRQWAERLRTLMEAYLLVDDEGDEADQLKILSAIDELAELDLVGTPVSGRTACGLAGQALAAISYQRGPYLSEGVVVSTFLPMRAIPFRAIFVLGLGEGIFPGAARRDPLDLRATRRAGDLSPAERDRHAFLETLLCARERLSLSWVYRNEKTGDLLAPSSILLDLLDVLEPVLGPEALRLPARADDGRVSAGRFFELVPLRRHQDPACTLPEARAEAEAARIGAALGHEGTRGLRHRELLEQLDDPALWSLLRLPETHPPAAAASPTPGVVSELRELTLSNLRGFLDSPVQGAARARLRLREDEDDEAAAVEDEPLTSSRLQESVFRTSTLEDSLRALPWRDDLPTRTDAAARVIERVRQAVLRASAPRGIFSGAPLHRDIDLVLAWRALLFARCEGPVRRVHVGRSREGERVDPPRLAALELSGADARPLRLHGLTSLLAGPGLDIVLPVDTARISGKRLHRSALRGLLDHLLLCATGEAELCPPRPRRLLLLGASPRKVSFDTPPDPDPAALAAAFELETLETSVVTLGLETLEAPEARALLEGLARQLLDEDHDHLLPVDVISELVDDTLHLEVELEAVRAAVAAVRERAGSAFGGTPSSSYGPIPDPFSLPWLEGEDAMAAIAARFAPLFARLCLLDDDEEVA
ncbi:MAG: exodeoxyribonuclease V subunit gamma [Deltaproteobacteria bacterium]|nr:exodeoxyribonuclease V subunit gamma [Deltaproteobacteria bacterium]